MKRFSGKAALVTGAASGIGLATARRFAAEGAEVVLADINIDAASAMASEIVGANGVRVFALGYNAAQAETCEAMVAQAITLLGRLDVLVNNAGIMHWSETHNCDPAMFEKVLKVNLHSVLHVTRASLPTLLAASGNIVNISSAAGLQGLPYAAAYCASKAGVLGLTRSLAVEYADKGVRVNAICPGAVDTPLNTGAPIPAWADMGKIAFLSPKTGKFSAPDEIASAVAYLASDEACNITGSALSVDGGQTAG
jgi:meso-butanediol dehydrogenase/(S,S)-butanediol dehydrogenase/diacetyl reductase